MKNHSLSCFTWNIFDIIKDFFFPSKEDKLFGKLFVSGKGNLEFVFKKHPKHIIVYFDDECHPIPCNPCNPGVDDYLFWSISKHTKHYVLTINWDVESMRTIIWKVC